MAQELGGQSKPKASCSKTLEHSEASLSMYNRTYKKRTHGSHGNPIKFAAS
jgi:hypothetical protein